MSSQSQKSAKLLKISSHYKKFIVERLPIVSWNLIRIHHSLQFISSATHVLIGISHCPSSLLILLSSLPLIIDSQPFSHPSNRLPSRRQDKRVFSECSCVHAETWFRRSPSFTKGKYSVFWFEFEREICYLVAKHNNNEINSTLSCITHLSAYSSLCA